MANAIPTAYETVQHAIKVLEFYQQFYASSERYLVHRSEVIDLIRNRAEMFKGTQHGDYKFLMLFAATLEVSNKPGEYVPYPGASA